MFAVLGFCYVPLGSHTGLEHAKAIFGTPAAKRAGAELVEAFARIRGKLTVHGERASFDAHQGRGVALLIPAGMAFGTGEHATTASCLRMLCDISTELPPDWRAIP